MVSLTRYSGLMEHANRMIKSIDLSDFFVEKTQKDIPFAYPCDNYIDTIFSNEIVRKSLQLFADRYCKGQIQSIKLSGQLVTKANYPHLYNVLQSCYKSLNVEHIPDVYVTNRLKGINALSVGSDNAPVILISRKAVINLTEGELKFMIGHELGHILQKNLMCHTIKGLLDNLNRKSEILGPIVSDFVEVPLNQWHRCAEYTADRAGIICAGNMSYVKSLFSRLCNNSIDEPNPISRYFELSNIHPMYNNRLNQLEQFILLQ